MRTYVCVKCGFELNRMAIVVDDGELVGMTTAGAHEEACPNGCRIDGAAVMLAELVEGGPVASAPKVPGP